MPHLAASVTPPTTGPPAATAAPTANAQTAAAQTADGNTAAGKIAEALRREGYAIVRGAIAADTVQLIRETCLEDRERRVHPFELEADTHYPGSPESPDSPGGQTIRRLLWAHSRGPVFSQLLTDAALCGPLQAYFGRPVVCPLAHHNCVMTKEPAFSSDTGWHQDIRYWSFPRPDLVSGWFALGPEREENGGLRVVPGSHAADFRREQFDEHLFFREDRKDNREVLSRAINVDLEAGDLLLFHGRTGARGRPQSHGRHEDGGRLHVPRHGQPAAPGQPQRGAAGDSAAGDSAAGDSAAGDRVGRECRVRLRSDRLPASPRPATIPHRFKPEDPPRKAAHGRPQPLGQHRPQEGT